MAAILLYTAPTFVVILSALLWKDRITKRKLAALVLAFLALLLWPASSTVP
ncbi:MAG: EamA family transporter [Evtepia gabavorous]